VAFYGYGANTAETMYVTAIDSESNRLTGKNNYKMLQRANSAPVPPFGLSPCIYMIVGGENEMKI
jgi:hypothetical protein